MDELVQRLRELTDYKVLHEAPIATIVRSLREAADLIERQQVELTETKQTEEALAVRVLGKERYDNSPCQAHPLELVEQHIAALRAQNAALLVKIGAAKEILRPLYEYDPAIRVWFGDPAYTPAREQEQTEGEIT